MADDRDDSQKTEDPTQKRLDDAREGGDLVKSTEVTSFVLLAGGALSIAFFGHAAAAGFVRNFRIFLEQPDQIPLDPGAMMVLFRGVMWSMAGILAPALGLIALMALGGNIAQSRPVFTTEKLKPDFAKLSPIAGFKRMFGFDGLTNLAKGALKIAIIGAVTWLTLWPERGRLAEALTLSPQDIAGDMMQILMKVLVAALSVLAVLAGLDYFLQRLRFLKRNRMSKQEIKEEYRQSEGDPTIKAKVRQIRVERSRRRMMAKVPQATVVVMNPTHFAVALQYESGKMAAPVCVAKGVDALALRIREVAEDNDVPVVENPPLARALYASVEIDEAVPPEHYKAVAQLIGYVMRLTGKIRPN